MAGNVLDFEKPIAQLEEKIAQVKRLTREEGIDRSQEIATLEAHVERLRHEIYQNLTPWDRTLIARHPARPFTLDYVRLLCDDFTELHGDRLFAEDPAMVGGVARIGERRLLVIGQQKGRDIHERQRRNFGSARPEGCAAIIWRDAKRGPEAAERLRITAEDALRFGAVDEVIAEPLGGAHRDYDGAARAVREAVLRHLEEVEAMPEEERLERRYLRFRRIGEYSEYGE